MYLLVKFMVYVDPIINIKIVVILFCVNVGSSYAGGQWAAGDEPLYYIVSPKDVVIAKPRLVLFILFYFIL